MSAGAWVRRALFFGASRAIGSRVGADYREWLALERASPSAVRGMADRRLEAILGHAARHVPYYRDRAGGGGASGLSGFPILTKDDIRTHATELMTPSVRAEHEGAARRRGYSWVAVKTGGSTGAPTTVIHDARFRDRGRASRLYSQRLCGFPFGTPYFRLWGSMADINRSADSFSHRALSRLAAEVTLNAFRMGPADMDQYLERMKGSPLRHLMAYVDAAQALAGHARRTGRAVGRLESVMACAGTVTAGARSEIASVFGSRVHNKYGSRDCTDMACECERGGLHVYSHHVHLEVVGDDGRALPAGQAGRLLVTLLGNRAFPMIRYEIGDVGALADGACPCGRPFPLLDRLEGRSLEFLTSVGGGYVSPVYIRHLVGVVHNPGFIRRFQLVQEAVSVFRLAIELESGVAESAFRELEARIRPDLLAVLGAGAALVIERVAEIAPSASGKFLYTVNRAGQTR